MHNRLIFIISLFSRIQRRQGRSFSSKEEANLYVVFLLTYLYPLVKYPLVLYWMILALLTPMYMLGSHFFLTRLL